MAAKTAAEVVNSVLTGTLERPTREGRVSMPITQTSNGSEPDPHDWTNRWQTHGDACLASVLAACAAFRSGVLSQHPPQWLTLLGPSGSGKSHMASAVWAEIRRHMEWNPTEIEYVPSLTYWPRMVDALRDGNAWGLYRDMARWPYLVLDDVAAERDPSGFSSDKLSTLLGCRERRWTVITSNLFLEDIARIDNRIASRMARNGAVLEITAGDYHARGLSAAGAQPRV